MKVAVQLYLGYAIVFLQRSMRDGQPTIQELFIPSNDAGASVEANIGTVGLQQQLQQPEQRPHKMYVRNRFYLACLRFPQTGGGSTGAVCVFRHF